MACYRVNLAYYYYYYYYYCCCFLLLHHKLVLNTAQLYHPMHNNEVEGKYE